MGALVFSGERGALRLFEVRRLIKAPELVGSRAGAVVREVVVLSVSRVSPFVPV